MEILEDVCDEIKRKWCWFKYGIRKTIQWLPVIWEDREWDYWFIYKLLHKKLTLMENAFRVCGISVHSDKEADKMRLCILLLDRLIKDNYHDNVHMFNKTNGENWQKDKKMALHEEYLVEQDLEYLFKIIRKNIRRWWD